MRPLLFLVILLPAVATLAEDVRSTDGTVYHQTKVVHVDPDGLVVKYDKGVAKIDFQRLSPEMQRRFGFNARQAAVYRAQEDNAVLENQRIVKEHEQHEIERIRKVMESSESGDELIFRESPGQATVARIARSIGRDMEAHEEAAMMAARAPRTFWTAPFWQSPVVKFLGIFLGGGGGGGGGGPINNGVGFDNHRGFSSP